ncbi:hypothetical protein ACE41H_13225 [Paenibacillus enshidis]|uniref:Uncharacterized protein n=1 Tax=Paenibacillus enshidis TaxID=1458439 RepID=A0ABV5AU41_9BACL
MYTGAALYQTESISPTEAFRLGEAFFHAMGVIKITDEAITSCLRMETMTAISIWRRYPLKH